LWCAAIDVLDMLLYHLSCRNLHPCCQYSTYVPFHYKAKYKKYKEV